MLWFLLDVICVVIISGTTVFLVKWLNVGEGFHIFIAVIGSFAYFFGKHLTGSGAFAHYRYVNSPTPEIIWKAAGVICWIVAAVSLFYHLPWYDEGYQHNHSIHEDLQGRSIEAHMWLCVNVVLAKSASPAHLWWPGFESQALIYNIDKIYHMGIFNIPWNLNLTPKNRMPIKPSMV